MLRMQKGTSKSYNSKQQPKNKCIQYSWIWPESIVNTCEARLDWSKNLEFEKNGIYLHSLKVNG